jgi:2-polyprenyl-3-methyl-5-hydroxy-6-metoxy-1,4-benzoquinol methylase
MVKWDERYKGSEFVCGKEPNQFLADNIHLFPKGRVLDIAAGEGRNSVFFAKHGFRVDAVDISEEGLKKAAKLAQDEGVDIKIIKTNLTNYFIEREVYDVIANFYYLQRDLIPKMKNGLKKGGAVIFETYILDQQSLPDGPKNHDYLLGHNELLSVFSDLRVIFYREGIFMKKDRKKAIASIIAIKN